MPSVLGLDLATRLTGWCAGDGLSVPTAGAFELPQTGEDIGEMLDLLDLHLAGLFERTRPSVVLFEAPILPSGGRKGDKGAVMGSALVRRKLMNLSGHVEFMCRRRGIEYFEDSVQGIKKELAGFAGAEKTDMVAAAQKVGVALPGTKSAGQEDAADAFGCWLLALRYADPAASANWDRVLHSSRGSLL